MQVKPKQYYSWLRRHLWSLPIFPIIAVVILSAASPFLLSWISDYLVNSRYQLSAPVNQIVGHVSATLASKISYSHADSSYFFNRSAISSTIPPSQGIADPGAPGSLLKKMKSQVGGPSNNQPLYAVQMPLNIKKGITYTDSNTGLNFKLVPGVSALAPKLEANHVVYPLSLPGNAAAVYTPKNNGLKEDIVLRSSPGTNSFSYSYTLNLPNTLQARMMPGGNVGIYSASKILYGHISYGSAADKQTVIESRINSPKTNLVFVIPAPAIKQTAMAPSSNVKAHFVLNGNLLTVRVNNLNGAHYPLSIDPSVVISGASGFASGNSESNDINYSNGAARDQLTGGILGTWSNTTALPTALENSTTVAVNNFIYVIGGQSTAAVSSVFFAEISSGGGLVTNLTSCPGGGTLTGGTWCTTSSLVNATFGASSVAYNGFIYQIGGSSGTSNNDEYAKINSDGSLGSWQITSGASNLPISIEYGTAGVYHNFLYSLGGYNTLTSTITSATYYAPLYANGGIGPWLTTTALKAATQSSTTQVYHGYIYEIGGYTTTQIANVYFAPLNANGTIGSWKSTTSLPVPLDFSESAIANGYLYTISGFDGSVSKSTTADYFARIRSDGTIGGWYTTTPIPTAIDSGSSVAYNGTVFEFGGVVGTAASTTSEFINIEPAGFASPWTTAGSLLTIGHGGSAFSSVENNAVVVDAGYIYSLGGDNGGTVYYTEVAPITNGVIGAWSQGTSLPTSYTGVQSVVYNNYVYIFGGCGAISSGSCGTHVADEATSAPITTSTGVIGAWTTLTAPPTGDWGGVATINNGYVYLLGGQNSSGTDDNTVYYAQLTTTGGLSTNSCGTSVTWCTASSFATGRQFFGATVAGNYLYIDGGVHATSDTACNATASTECSDVQFAEINSSGGLVGGLTSCPNSGTLTNGTWCSTTSLPTTVTGGLYTYRGYLYAPDGYYAPLGANGTVSSWAANNAYATLRTNYGSAYNSGYLYVVGGVASGTIEFDSQYTNLNNGGGSGTNSAWSTNSSTGLPALSGAMGVAYNGYLYVLGGNNGSFVASVYCAPINSDGSVGNWALSPNSLPKPTGSGAAFAYDGYIYVLGGQTSTAAATSQVLYAPINSDGTIGTWQTETQTMPSADKNFGFTFYKGYAYVSNGYSGTANLATTMYAPVGSNGVISGWATGAYSTATAVARNNLVAANGYLYFLGGIVSGTVYSNAVYSAQIGANGAPGAWFQLPNPEPTDTSWSGSVILDGYLYMYGGYNGTVQTRETLYAAVLPSGGLGPWHTSSNLIPIGVQQPAYASYNGYLYAATGYTNSTNSNTNAVYYTGVQLIPRVASYSTAFYLTSPAHNVSVSFAGSLSHPFQDISIEIALGNNPYSGATLNSFGNGNNVCNAAGTVWVHVSLDDSADSIFPDVDSSNSYLTSLTLNYTVGGHPPTNLRLRGGAFFFNNTLQPLDTCH